MYAELSTAFSIQYWHVAHCKWQLKTHRHTFDGSLLFQSHLVDPLVKGSMCVYINQHLPNLSQWFSSKKCTQRELQYFYWLAYMHFEICTLLCHFCLFWRFSNKIGEMSPRTFIDLDLYCNMHWVISETLHVTTSYPHFYFCIYLSINTTKAKGLWYLRELFKTVLSCYLE